MSAPTMPDLLQSFLDEAWETVAVFEQAAEFLAIERHEPLVVMAHRLKGSAGLYGFPQTSNLGALAERILEAAPHYTDPQRAKVVEFMGQVTAVLITALENIAIHGQEGRVGLELGRLGAADLILELTALNPGAFVRKAPEPNQEATPQPASPQTGLVEELQHFYRQNAEFWEFFAPETLENLDHVGNALVGLQSGDETGEHLRALFRAMHTVKGAAYSVGCKPIGTLAHQLEDLMVEVREGRQPWGSEMAQVMLEGALVLGKMVVVAEGKDPQAAQSLDGQVLELQSRLARMLGREAPVSPAPQAPSSPATPPASPQRARPGSTASVRVSLERLDALLNLAGETLVTRSRLELLAQRFEEMDHLLETARQRLLRTTTDFENRYLNPRLSLVQETQSQPSQAHSNLGKTVQELFSELEFDRYDDLNILARSIQEMTSDLAEVRSSLSEQIKAFRQETEQFEKLSQNLRNEVNRARLIPIGRFYQRLTRQIQQIAGNKQVHIKFQGEQVEIDSVLLDGLSEALIHLVNNAVIHGLESPEERLAHGKPAQGTLTIRTQQQRNILVLEISDDGRGINLEAVKQKAVEKGLRTQEQIAAMRPEDAVQLIFIPGLSTAEVVSDVAGRGVGMDAVAATIRRLRGDLAVETRPGLGTTIRLRIPQNLVVSDILLLQTGGQVVALPRESLLTLLTAPADQQEVAYEGSRIPIKPLSALLGLPPVAQPEYALAVVEGRGGVPVALAVERFIGLQQALVKPLAAPLSELPHLTGATVSATGEVILVLSPSGLLSLDAALPIQTRIEPPRSQRFPVLLVDDSLSVRKVVGQMLRKAGYQVVTAADGQEALELLEQQPFQAVVTDLEMPRMSGFELLEEVRRRPKLSHLPIAVLTTRASAKHRDLAVELGANAYLTKPADEVELDKFLQGV
ncbi:MAG: response regulator [Meiothermus sp.]|uniref:hybrid sensor histidine kinase/response regulator n=1 Tax=Meiothermus sp. TaxID=1955249 RepID=UPI0025D83BB4|nr:response regulator [Meiothermus sp.]MCS7068331.1 response regulator [Meiothermus sp.]